jgi:hypothetical protein
VGETASLEALLKLFTFTKKRDLERYCRALTVESRDFVSLILSCEQNAKPFLHQITFKDIVPEHLIPSDDEWAALAKNPAGELSAEAAKTVSKMAQLFDDRRYLVGHIFFMPDQSRWHFFCFDQRDLEDQRPNHWKEGPHVHFINWLWPRQNAEELWSHFIRESERPGGDFHLRFSMDTDSAKQISGK